MSDECVVVTNLRFDSPFVNNDRRVRDYAESVISVKNHFDTSIIEAILVVKVPEETLDKNLAGLVANQLANKYARPTLILRICENEDGSITYAGSGRKYNNSKLENFR